MPAPTVIPCPDPDTLERFLLGRLDSWQADTLDGHVSVCPTCADRLAGVPAVDGLVDVLRRRSAVLDAVLPNQVESVLARVRDTPIPPLVGSEPDREVLDPPAQPGDLGCVGPYRVIRELGRGGMGVVYLAEDSRLRRPVALKFVHGGRADDPHYRARFDREADALARLRHPNIVPVYEAGRHHGRPFLALAFVGGGTLAGSLQGRPQPPPLAAALSVTLADAVQYAHALGIVHRDLKPGNILVSDAPGSEPEQNATTVPKLDTGLLTPFITDFGLARHMGDEELTQTSDLLGTPGYMAPEMTRGGVAGAKDAPAVDVYSLGAILYECLTGRPPFRGETVIDTFEQVRTLDPVSPRHLQPKVPRDLETICLKCLAKEPHKRYATAAALSEDLRRFLAGKPVRARRASPMERAVKWARRKPGWASVVAVSVLATAALAVVAVRYEGRLRGAVAAAETSAAEARREKENARINYREARAALEKMLSRAADRGRGDLPRVRQLRKDQQEDALAFYLAIAANASDADPEVRWDAAQARLQASLLQIQLGRAAEARANLGHAAELARGLVADFPDESRYRRAFAESRTQLGIITPLAESQPFLEEALRELEALHAADPAAQDIRSDLARLNHFLGQRAYQMKEYEAAERYDLRAIGIRQALLAEKPGWRDQRVALGQTQVNLLLVRQQTKAPAAEQDALVASTAESLEAAVTADPSDPTPLVALAGLRLNWANTQMNRGLAAVAVADLGRPIELLEAFLAREPDWAEARHMLYSARGTRALAHDRQGQYAAAAVDYRRVTDLAPTAEKRMEHRVDLASLLLLARDHAAAAAESDRAAEDPTALPYSGSLHRHLRTCALLANMGPWVIRPYRIGAIRAARLVLDRTRKQLPASIWATWLRDARKDSEVAGFLDHPELRDLANGP